VFEHDSVVGGVEGVFEVRVHDVDVLVVNFGIFHHHHDGGEGVVDATLVAEPILLVASDAVGFAYFEPASLISAVRSLIRLFMRAMGRYLSRRVG
jgi:hypothetical protein